MTGQHVKQNVLIKVLSSLKGHSCLGYGDRHDSQAVILGSVQKKASSLYDNLKQEVKGGGGLGGTRIMCLSLFSNVNPSNPAFQLTP